MDKTDSVLESKRETEAGKRKERARKSDCQLMPPSSDACYFCLVTMVTEG